MHSVTVFVDKRFTGGLPAIEGIKVVLATVIFHNPGDSLLTGLVDTLFKEEGWEDELPPLQPDKIEVKTETDKIRNIMPMIFFINYLLIFIMLTLCNNILLFIFYIIPLILSQ
jgi:hypothetical protein